jgi:hypothetical protein
LNNYVNEHSNVISKKIRKKLFVGVLKVTDEKSRIRNSGSVNKRCGSADLDPQPNVTDPEHCLPQEIPDNLEVQYIL